MGQSESPDLRLTWVRHRLASEWVSIKGDICFVIFCYFHTVTTEDERLHKGSVQDKDILVEPPNINVDLEICTIKSTINNSV